MMIDAYKLFLRFGLVSGLLACIALVIFWTCNKDIVPDWDMVSTLHFLLGGRTDGPMRNLLSSDVLKVMDNEHRPVLPMFIWAADLKFFGSRGYLPQALILLFSIFCAVLATSWSQLSKERSQAAFTITVFACIIMLSPMHYENLVWPKQVHVLTAILLSLLSFAVSLWIPAAKGWSQVRRAALASALAFAATFSFAYGLVTWPVLLIHGALARWPIRAYVVIFLAASITIGLYYTEYTVLAHHSDPRQTIFDPLSLFSYAAGLLATPLDLWSRAASVLTGTVLILFVAWAALRLYFKSQNVDRSQSMSLMICIYAGGIAFLTALGRVGVNLGNDSRYLVVSAIFLLALPGLLKTSPAGQSPAGRASIVIFVMLATAVSAQSWLNYEDPLRNRQFMIREGAIAAALNTQPIFRGLHPVPEIINDTVWPYYSRIHKNEPLLEIFSWLGKPVPLESLIDSNLAGTPRCMGFIDRITNRGNDPKFDLIEGWARLGAKGERQATWVLVTNSNKVLIGLATVGVARPDVARALNGSWIDNLLTATGHAGFIGLVQAQPGEKLEFYAYRDGEACSFATLVQAPET